MNKGQQQDVNEVVRLLEKMIEDKITLSEYEMSILRANFPLLKSIAEGRVSAGEKAELKEKIEDLEDDLKSEKDLIEDTCRQLKEIVMCMDDSDERSGLVAIIEDME